VTIPDLIDRARRAVDLAAGGDRGFATGAIYPLAATPDGTVWALSFEVLPEYD
jgi:hypothetical protein